MSTAEEATINPDGTTQFPSDPQPQSAPSPGTAEPPPNPYETAQPASATGIDPALYLIAAVLLAGLFFYFFVHRKRSQQKEDNFFLELDGEKFNFDLPTEVDAYYKIKEKCLEQGWKPGTPMPPAPTAANPQQLSGPQRVLAQALMKRAIADIPIVQHIQKEASGMNKLYAQSMCSVQQWKSFQNAEAMIAAEIDSVRGEADALDPGWSQYVWKQAMQYHQVLKQKHEQEEKKKQELANQRKIVEANVAAAQAARTKEDQEKIAQQAADELLKAEERDKQSKKAFSAKSTTIKKGFLENNGTTTTTNATSSATSNNNDTNSNSNSSGKTGAKGKKKK